MNQQTILKNLEIADKIIDEAYNTGYTLQDSDIRILKSIFSIIKEELNITRCPDCKYCVKTKDGEYNPDDIVCSYWGSDGLGSKDFCSYGEKGAYVYEEDDKNIKKTNVDEGTICEKCGFKVPLKYLSCPLCKELDKIDCWRS